MLAAERSRAVRKYARKPQELETGTADACGTCTGELQFSSALFDMATAGRMTGHLTAT